jgi:hypothetical protein
VIFCLALVAAILGAILCHFVYVVALFVLGFAGGLILGIVLMGFVDSYVDPATVAETWWTVLTWAIAIVLGIILGLITLKLKRALIIAATAVLGSYVIVAVLDYFIGDGTFTKMLRNAFSGVQNDVTDVVYVMLIGWCLLALLGMLVQFKIRKHGPTPYSGRSQVKYGGTTIIVNNV